MDLLLALDAEKYELKMNQLFFINHIQLAAGHRNVWYLFKIATLALFIGNRPYQIHGGEFPSKAKKLSGMFYDEISQLKSHRYKTKKKTSFYFRIQQLLLICWYKCKHPLHRVLPIFSFETTNGAFYQNSIPTFV